MYPKALTMKTDFFQTYKNCIEACLRCSSISSYCATMDLHEKDMEMMARCAQLNIECAAICSTTAQLLSMNSSYAKDLCKICAEVCMECAVECGQHQNEHCQACAELCTACADECNKLARA